MPTARPHIVVDDLVFPESPRWIDGRLWCSDMHGHELVVHEPGGPTVRIPTPGAPSGIGALPDGSLLVVSMDGRVLWRLEDDAFVVHADLRALPGEFLNDMVVDADGRAYVGSRHHRRRGEPPRSDVLALVEPDGTARIAAEGVIGPNGVVITPDGSTLILAETQARRITAFDRTRGGELANRRLVADLGDRFPDGMCLDASGSLWVGTAIGQEFLRIDEGGGIVSSIGYDDRWAVACALGGPGRTTLFLCTAATTLEGLGSMFDLPWHDGRDHRRAAAAHSHGRIEAVAVDAPGVGWP